MELGYMLLNNVRKHLLYFKMEIGSSSGVRDRTHSPEIEYSEEDEEDLEEDPEEDPEEAPEEESEEDPEEEDFEEEELLDESDVEEYRSEHFWSYVRRYRNLREDADIANSQEQIALNQVRRQMRSFSIGMLTVRL
ncbi:uncharacterized protein LOC126677280 [Mercurialis annua]|uniref:uncharacterized protein LOC126677280 n=1 Tax=Mercurialis annua TaxID=3986 RepID=UPI00215E8D08|nr:uncharacterized protein LOC126677280 [Mercurialis annua]